MKLYGHPFSNNTRRVQMLCEECNIPYQYKTVDLMNGEHYSPDFLAINPNGMVPVIDDDGFLLWESQAIMRYLANKFNATSWYPTETRERAKVDAWLDWNHTRLGAETAKIAFNTLILGDKGDKLKIKEGIDSLDSILPVLNDTLKIQPYMGGDTPCIADLSAASNFAYLEMCHYDINKYPAIYKWYKNMKSRNSFSITAI